jgi:hypothetical protein
LDRWDPEPILQAYSAYTDGLDSQDSHFLDSNGAPQAILQGIPMAIDGRYAAWEPPTTELTMLCRYHQLAISTSWELLGRVPNRCGSPQLLETKTVHAGNFVPVPAAPAGDIEVATFSGLGTSLSYRLASVAFKPAVVVVNIQISIYLVATRILTGTQGDFHVLSVPPSAGFSSPFSPDTILDVQFDGLYSSNGSATIKFYGVPIH